MKRTIRSSTAYVRTVTFSDESDMFWLKELRTATSATNASLRKIGQRPFRIRLALRAPIKKQVIRNFYTGQTRLAGYDWGGNVVGGIANAAKADVYIYDDTRKRR